MQLQYYGAVEHQGTTRLGFGKKRRRSNNNAANQHSAAWRRTWRRKKSIGKSNLLGKKRQIAIREFFE